jgi:hypothetical protein
VLNHLLEPVYSGFEDMWDHFLVDSSENFRDRVQEFLPALTIVIREFSFEKSKEEEIPRGQVWDVSRIRQAFGS